MHTKSVRIAVINGPNLNMLGKRNPEVYGTETLADTIEELRTSFPEIELSSFQSNCEGKIIDYLQEIYLLSENSQSEKRYAGVVINPGAYAHYSYAIADAIADLRSAMPVVEVHISNIFSREGFRHTSVTAGNATALVSGMGRTGYSVAIDYILRHAQLPAQK